MRAGGLLRYLFYCGVFGREVAEMKMVGETGGPRERVLRRPGWG